MGWSGTPCRRIATDIRQDFVKITSADKAHWNYHVWGRKDAIAHVTKEVEKQQLADRDFLWKTCWEHTWEQVKRAAEFRKRRRVRVEFHPSKSSTQDQNGVETHLHEQDTLAARDHLQT